MSSDEVTAHIEKYISDNGINTDKLEVDGIVKVIKNEIENKS